MSNAIPQLGHLTSWQSAFHCTEIQDFLPLCYKDEFFSEGTISDIRDCHNWQPTLREVELSLCVRPENPVYTIIYIKIGLGPLADRQEWVCYKRKIVTVIQVKQKHNWIHLVTKLENVQKPQTTIVKHVLSRYKDQTIYRPQETKTTMTRWTKSLMVLKGKRGEGMFADPLSACRSRCGPPCWTCDFCFEKVQINRFKGWHSRFLTDTKHPYVNVRDLTHWEMHQQ